MSSWKVSTPLEERILSLKVVAPALAMVKTKNLVEVRSLSLRPVPQSIRHTNEYFITIILKYFLGPPIRRKDLPMYFARTVIMTLVLVWDVQKTSYSNMSKQICKGSQIVLLMVA